MEKIGFFIYKKKESANKIPAPLHIYNILILYFSNM